MKGDRIIIFLLFLYIVLLVSQSIVSSFDKQILWSISIGMIAVSLFLFRHEPNSVIRNIYFRPVHLFLLAYIIVFFQKPLDYVLGYQPDATLMGNTQIMPYCVMLATLGLLSFLVGYCLRNFNYTISSSREHVKASVVIFKILTSAILLTIVIVTPRSILFGGYGQQFLDSNSSFNYLSSWCRVFIVAFYVQFVINNNVTSLLVGCSFWTFIKEQGFWMNANLLLYAIIILNLGDRGPLIILATAVYLAYTMISRRTLSRWSLMIIVVICIVFSSLLGKTKQHRDNNTFVDRIRIELQSNEYSDNTSIVPSTEELALSYRCLPYAVEYVPARQPHTMGLLQISYLLTAIPFSATIIGSIIHLPENSAYMISHFVQGAFINSGEGSNCVADFYIDGGILMVIIGLFLWGYFCRYFEVQLFHKQQSSLFVTCMAYYFLIHCIYMPRSTILNSFKYAVWLSVIILLYQAFVIRSKRR